MTALLYCTTVADANKVLESIKDECVELHEYIVDKSEHTYWVPAFVCKGKPDWYVLTSNCVEQVRPSTKPCHPCLVGLIRRDLKISRLHSGVRPVPRSPYS